MIFRSPLPEIVIPALPLAEFVLGQAGERASKPALIDAETGRTIGYGQLVELVERAASGLRRLGLREGDVLATLLPNLPEFPAVFLAVARAGGICSTMSPLYTSSEVATQLRDSGARFLVTVPTLLETARTATAGLDVRMIVVGSAQNSISFDELAAGANDLAQPDIDPTQDLAALPYSSGTTGLPKGVMITHRNLVANTLQCSAFNVVDDDVIIAVAPFFHIMGMSCIMLNGLFRGVTLVTMPRFDLARFLAAIECYRVSCAILAPPLLLALAQHPLVDRYDLSSLRWVVSGGAPLGAEVGRACAQRLGCQLGQGWGMTECAGVGATYPPGAGKPGTIGVPVPNTEMKVIDTVTGAELGPGEIGEICLRGPNVMKGYFHQPAATAATITSEGWLRTGDIGSIDTDGFLSIVDRLKELIKYKGYQVAPAELEALLLAHPAVVDAVVIPSPDEQAGEVPKAFLVLKTDSCTVPDPEQVIAWATDQVAPYKRIRRYELIDVVPRTASGKIVRRGLIERERKLQSATPPEQ
jgi:acyl-CoA synthetase (AMP-forming)/AMP-acid ligase II